MALKGMLLFFGGAGTYASTRIDPVILALMYSLTSLSLNVMGLEDLVLVAKYPDSSPI
jgi:hypothetical protein